jgi:hypothetical protein
MVIWLYLQRILIDWCLQGTHCEGKELTRCDKVRSFIASTCFGHQYAHHQEYN